MELIEFHERRDGSSIAGVHIGNTVHAMTCKEWRDAANSIINHIDEYERKKAKTYKCDDCRDSGIDEGDGDGHFYFCHCKKGQRMEESADTNTKIKQKRQSHAKIRRLGREIAEHPEIITCPLHDEELDQPIYFKCGCIR